MLSLHYSAAQQQRNHTKKELQDFVRNNGADLFEDKELVVPGWKGQPKGLLQVLRERGLIDTLLLAQFTVDGRKILSQVTSTYIPPFATFSPIARTFRKKKRRLSTWVLSLASE
jgi:hypothetical protein